MSCQLRIQQLNLLQIQFPPPLSIKACIKESFRIHPVNPFNVPYIYVSDTNVAGHFIPRGSHILFSRPGLGRNPRVWPEPLCFIPERHLNDDGSNVDLTDPDLRILSFSIGRCGCVGVTLGSTMTVMLFARLLHGFSWSLPPDEAKIELKESPGDLLLARPVVAIAKPRLDEKLYQQLGLF